ncbi:MAG: hypothetical protein ACLTVG_21965 [Coprococcus sp.]|jgi:hypothetical protein
MENPIWWKIVKENKTGRDSTIMRLKMDRMNMLERSDRQLVDSSYFRGRT